MPAWCSVTLGYDGGTPGLRHFRARRPAGLGSKSKHDGLGNLGWEGCRELLSREWRDEGGSDKGCDKVKFPPKFPTKVPRREITSTVAKCYLSHTQATAARTAMATTHQNQCRPRGTGPSFPNSLWTNSS